MLLPSIATRRPRAVAASTACEIRATWLENVVRMMRPGASPKASASPPPATRSESGLRESFDVRRLAVRGVRVELEVAGVQHRETRRFDPDRGGVRHGVGDAEERDRERARLDPLASLRLEEARGLPRLLEAPAGERQRERKAVDRSVTPLREERQRSHVILVAVREDDRVDVYVPERREVRRDPVDARERLVRKRDSDVDEEVRPAAGKPEHVAAELAQPPQSGEDDLRRSTHAGRIRRSRSA
jgi:hypothetical protein